MVVSERARRHVGDLPAAVESERLRSALRQPPRHEVLLAVVEEAREAGGPIAAAQALALAHHRLLRPGLGELRHRVAEDLIAEGSRTMRHSDTVTGLLWRLVDFILDGDARAARCLTELRALLAVRDEPGVRYVLQAIETMLEIRAGRFDSAEHRAKECAALGAEVGDVDAAAWYGSHLIAIRWYQGRVDEMVPAIREVAAAPNLSPADQSYETALAVAAAVAGYREEALDALYAACDRAFEQLPRSGSWLVAMYGIVEAAFLLGEREIAQQAYWLLLPYAALPATAGPAVSCFGSVEHCLGLARLTLQDPDGAVEHLRRAVSHNTALGHFPAATLARARLAHALARSGDPEQRAAAVHEAATAQRDANELGMTLPLAPSTPTPAHVSGAAPAHPVPSSAGTNTATGTGTGTDTGSGTGVGAGAPSCRRHGRHWQITAAGRTIQVEHCRGMTYLAVLLANPGTEIPALELTTTPHPVGIDTGPADEEAAVEYRERLKELQQEIDRCDAVGDQQGAIRAHAERDMLLARLRPAGGLADAALSRADAEERARVAVGKAIRRAVTRIADIDSQIGVLLSATVHTGRRCVYVPLED